MEHWRIRSLGIMVPILKANKPVCSHKTIHYNWSTSICPTSNSGSLVNEHYNPFSCIIPSNRKRISTRDNLFGVSISLIIYLYF